MLLIFKSYTGIVFLFHIYIVILSNKVNFAKTFTDQKMTKKLNNPMTMVVKNQIIIHTFCSIQKNVKVNKKIVLERNNENKNNDLLI